MSIFKCKRKMKKMILASCTFLIMQGNVSIVEAFSSTGYEWTHAGFDEVKYFEAENLLRLQDGGRKGSYFFVDLSGNMIEEPNLQSQYLVDIENEDDGGYFVYNGYGKELSHIFIDDPEWQECIGSLSFSGGDWIWIKELEPTLEKTKIYVKAFDVVTGKEIYKIDCNPYTTNIDYDITLFDYLDTDDAKLLYLKYSYENALLIDLETGQVIEDCEIMYGVSDGHGYKSVDTNKFVDGYDKIIDFYGNTIIDSSEQNIGGMSSLSEGLFFCKATKSFYDIDLNKVIDLSEYPLYFDNEWYSYYYRTNLGHYFFVDGYCSLAAENEDGTRFFALIDKKGNFVIDWTLFKDGTDYFKYEKKLSDNLLCICTTNSLDDTAVYDLTTNEITPVPQEILNGVRVNDKIYYTIPDILYCYDLNTKESKEMEIHGLAEQNDHLADPTTLVGLWNEIDSYPDIKYFFYDDFTFAKFRDYEQVDEGTYWTYEEGGDDIIEIRFHRKDPIELKYELYDNMLVLLKTSGNNAALERVSSDEYEYKYLENNY